MQHYMRRLIENKRNIPHLSMLVIGIFLFIFVLPVLVSFGIGAYLIPLSFTVILISLTSIVNTKNTFFLGVIALAIVFQWLAYFNRGPVFHFSNYISFLLSTTIFALITFNLIGQIVRAKDVDVALILQTVSGYLLIGIILVLVNTLIISVNPEAISFGSNSPKFSEIVYFSFINYTTIGFGDISPVSPLARSVSILFGIIGQFYLSIIIAFIIGKFLNKQSNQTKEQ